MQFINQKGKCKKARNMVELERHPNFSVLCASLVYVGWILNNGSKWVLAPPWITHLSSFNWKHFERFLPKCIYFEVKFFLYELCMYTMFTIYVYRSVMYAVKQNDAEQFEKKHINKLISKSNGSEAIKRSTNDWCFKVFDVVSVLFIWQFSSMVSLSYGLAKFD